MRNHVWHIVIGPNRRTGEPPAERVPTFPSWSPKRGLDHVLVGGFHVHGYQALPAAGSDHLAVAVELSPK